MLQDVVYKDRIYKFDGRKTLTDTESGTKYELTTYYVKSCISTFYHNKTYNYLIIGFYDGMVDYCMSVDLEKLLNGSDTSESNNWFCDFDNGNNVYTHIKNNKLQLYRNDENRNLKIVKEIDMDIIPLPELFHVRMYVKNYDSIIKFADKLHNLFEEDFSEYQMISIDTDYNLEYHLVLRKLLTDTCNTEENTPDFYFTCRLYDKNMNLTIKNFKYSSGVISKI